MRAPVVVVRWDSIQLIQRFIHNKGLAVLYIQILADNKGTSVVVYTIDPVLLVDEARVQAEFCGAYFPIL
jgi:hypothetical protein